MHLRRFFCLAALGVFLSVPSRAFPEATDTEVAALMHRAAGERKRGDYASAAATYRQVLERGTKEHPSSPRIRAALALRS